MQVTALAGLTLTAVIPVPPGFRAVPERLAWMVRSGLVERYEDLGSELRLLYDPARSGRHHRAGIRESWLATVRNLPGGSEVGSARPRVIAAGWGHCCRLGPLLPAGAFAPERGYGINRG